MTTPREAAERIARALRRHTRKLTAGLVGTLLLLLTAVTLVDVIGRYAFNAPLPGGTEMTQLLVMSIVFAGLPAICLDDAHVTVDLFTSVMPDWLLEIQLLVARLFVAGILGLVCWQLWLHGLRLASWNQTTIYLGFPLAPVAQAASVICGVSALMVLMMAVFRLPREQ